MSEQMLVNVSGLEVALQKFAEERGWERFHSPKNLAMALTVEVGELLEIFQWLTEVESKEIMRNPESAQAVREEVADVLIYLVRLSSRLGIDLDTAVKDKLQRNSVKYPAGLR